MKKSKKTLRLNKETLINLQSGGLRKVAGGWPETNYPGGCGYTEDAGGCQTEVNSVCIENTCNFCPHDVTTGP